MPRFRSQEFDHGRHTHGCSPRCLAAVAALEEFNVLIYMENDINENVNQLKLNMQGN